jgi:hypothetical protein
MSQIKIQ